MPRLLPIALFALCAPAMATPSPASMAPPAHCPQASEQLDELLASAMQRHAVEGDVRLEFLVDASGRAWLSALDGSRRYQGPVRRAVESLQCTAGEPRRYAVQIRFRDQQSGRLSHLASR